LIKLFDAGDRLFLVFRLKSADTVRRDENQQNKGAAAGTEISKKRAAAGTEISKKRAAAGIRKQPGQAAGRGKVKMCIIVYKN
jgi:hypothetical protein